MTPREVRRIRVHVLRMTVEQFARAIGVTKSTVLRWENARCHPALDSERRILAAWRAAERVA